MSLKNQLENKLKVQEAASKEAFGSVHEVFNIANALNQVDKVNFNSVEKTKQNVDKLSPYRT